jgi:hypothetical protein
VAIVAALTLWLVACPPALAQLNFTSTDVSITDLLVAGAGHDRMSVRGGGRDHVICGRGHDTVIADERDRVRGCERSLR